MLTSREREKATVNLRRYMEALPQDALARVREATDGEWRSGMSVDELGRRCLIGHAEWACLDRRGICHLVAPSAHPRQQSRAAQAFDDLCDADGLAVTVGSVKLLATVLLRSREIASLEVFCPLAAREETHA